MVLWALVVATASFCGASGLLWLAAGWSDRTRLCVVGLVATGAALGAVAAEGAPTGLGPWDGVLRALAAGLVVGAAVRARPSAVVASAALAVTASGRSPALWAAAAALGAAASGLAGGRRGELPAALAGAGTAFAVLRLEWPEPDLRSAAAGALVLAPMLVSALAARPGRRRLVRAGLAVAGVAALLTLPAAVAVATTRGEVGRSVVLAREGVRLAGEGRPDPAAERLEAAGAGFAAAHRTADSWWARPGLLVPVVARQLRAVRAATAAGSELGRVGAEVVVAAAPGSALADGGVVDLDAIEALGPPLERASSALARAGGALAAADSPWLMAPVSRRFDDLAGRVESAGRSAEAGLRAVRVAPPLLGRGGGRRWFLAIVNPAEARASGGIIGNFGEIEADEGRLRLTRVGRNTDLNLAGDPVRRELEARAEYVRRYAGFDPERVWQNVPVSPDFPAVAEVVRGLYPQSGGQPVDGVISVDPIGLAALLAVVGPVQVEGWPEPLSAENAPTVLMYDQYVRFGGSPDRVDFLGDAATAIWQRLTETELPGPAVVADALGPALRGRHVQLWAADPRLQTLLEELGVAGAFHRSPGHDTLGVTTQNASGNKIDWFMSRSVDYQVRLDPGDGTLRASLTVRLQNDAPADGLPDILISGYPGISPPGFNKTFLSVYSPWELAGPPTENGRPMLTRTEREAGMAVYSSYLSVAPGTTTEVRFELAGRMGDGADYRLDLLAQPSVRPDELAVDVQVDRRWRIGSARGWSSVGASGASWDGPWAANLQLGLDAWRILPW